MQLWVRRERPSSRPSLDIYLHYGTYRPNVPASASGDKLGSYQVLKKWPSYREYGDLDRSSSQK